MAADTEGGTERERFWSTALYSVVASGPVFLVGCTIAFPSAALLDLTDFDSTQSDLFGVSCDLNHRLKMHYFADNQLAKPC